MRRLFGPKADKEEVDSYKEGMRLYRRGMYARALRRLSRVGAGDGLIARVSRFYAGMSHRALGIEAMKGGRFGQAERHLRAAIELIGPQADLTGYLAAIYANTGRHEACADRLESVTCGESAARAKLARAQWRAGRKEQAYMTLGAALRDRPDDAELSMQLAMFHAAEERFAEARRTFERVVETDCTNWLAHRYLALSAAAQGDAFAAAHALQRALNLRPVDLMLALELSLAARAASAGGREVAIQLPEPAAPAGSSQVRQLAAYVTAETDFIDAFVRLPESEADAELFGMLAGVVRTALADHDDYADLHYHCSRVMDRLKRPDLAISHARRAVDINPHYVKALIQLGRLQEGTGNLAAGAGCIRRAIACGADWPDVHCLAGEWLVRAGRPKEATKHFTRAMELKSPYPRAARGMAAMAA